MIDSVDLGRLRRGELVAGASGVVLLLCMVLVNWYGTGARLPASTYTGWEALSIVRWLIVLTIAATLALVVLQATQRAPALPVAASVIVTTLGGVTVLALVYRVLIDRPGVGPVDPKLGAFLGLLSAIGIAYGGYLSLRQEGMPDGDGSTEIETVVADRMPIDR